MNDLAEMKVLNEQFSRGGALAPPPEPRPRGTRLLVVSLPKSKHTSARKIVYYDRAEYYVHDRQQVSGWDEEELADLNLRVLQLQGMVHLDALVAVDRR